MESVLSSVLSQLSSWFTPNCTAHSWANAGVLMFACQSTVLCSPVGGRGGGELYKKHVVPGDTSIRIILVQGNL